MASGASRSHYSFYDKELNEMRSYLFGLMLVMGALLSRVASADPAAIAAAVDFASVITAVGVVGVALAGVFIAMKGARLVLRFLR